MDGIDFVVTVPEGGVTEGQPFQVPYPDSSAPSATEAANVETPATNTATAPTTTATGSAANHVITGRWRNDLCSCFDMFGNGMVRSVEQLLRFYPLE